MITSTEPALCTNAPVTGVKIPGKDKPIAVKLRIMANAKFYLIVLIMRLDNAIR